MLNVGFGLGLVDTAIQSNHPRSHTIIEAHPDVLRKVNAQHKQQHSACNLCTGQHFVFDNPQNCCTSHDCNSLQR